MAIISILFFSVVVMMFIAAGVSLAPASLGSSSHFAAEHAARRAAEAGLEYARARMKEDPTWRGGGGNGRVVTVDSADGSMIVVEDEGNVVGLFPGSPPSQFRIRFNYQDGSGNGDELDDPSSRGILDFRKISLNNLSHPAASAIPEEQNGEVVETSATVGAFSAYVAVEGRAGIPFRDHSASEPNAKLGHGPLARKVVTATLSADFSESLDAAVMAAGDLDVDLTRAGARPIPLVRQMRIEARGREFVPRVRSKGSLSVQNSSTRTSLIAKNGFVDSGSGTLETGTTVHSSTSVGQEPENAGFYKLAWSDLAKADPDPLSTESVNLKAGTYVVWRASNSNNGSLHYYDMDYADYAAYIYDHPDDPGLTLSRDLREVRNNWAQVGGNEVRMTYTPGSTLTRAQLNIRRSVHVEPTSAGTREFNFIPRQGAIEGPPDPVTGEIPGAVLPGMSQGVRAPNQGFSTNMLALKFEPPGRRQQAILTTTDGGSILIGGRLKGVGGAITSGQDLSVRGAGTLRARTVQEENTTGINLFARRDIELNSYSNNWRNDGGMYRSLNLHGVIYAWGDIELKSAFTRPVPDGFRRGQNGTFQNFGALVAYGANPGDSLNGEPGEGQGELANKGNIKIRAEQVTITFDSGYIGALSRTAQPNDLSVVSWSLK